MPKLWRLVDTDADDVVVDEHSAEDVVLDEEWKHAGRLLRGWYSAAIEDGVDRSAIIYALVTSLAVMLSLGVQPAARDRNRERANEALRQAMLSLP